jgi:hypothetical protein
MEIMRDYLSNVKLPIIALVCLFFIHAILFTAIDLFTDLALDQTANLFVLGGINLAFMLIYWIVIAWAGLRTARAVGGGAFDGAIAGAITAVVAGFAIRVIAVLLLVSKLPILIAYSPELSGIAGFFGVLFELLLIIIGFFIDLVGGAFFGMLGGVVQGRKTLAALVRRGETKVGLLHEEKAVVKEARIVRPGKEKGRT